MPRRDRTPYQLREAERVARRRRERYAYAIAKLGGRCAHCGAGESEGLEFDHVSREGKVAPVMRLWSYAVAFEEELAKCQLLCWECHQRKTGCERHALAGTRPAILDEEEPPF